MIEFAFQECIEEIQSLALIANRFIDPRTAFVLKNLVSDLQNVRDHASDKLVMWQIPKTTPLTTIQSKVGKDNLTAELTSVWEIKAKSKKKGLPHTFVLGGKASTVVRIFRHDDGTKDEIAMWRMEVADPAAPGCCFHVQVLGELETPPFPHSLSIPRLPSILVTPVAVFEFVVGEFFQDQWRRIASEETAPMKRWRSIQAFRLTQLLKWAVGVISRSGSSPWMNLKSEYPPADLFIRPV